MRLLRHFGILGALLGALSFAPQALATPTIYNGSFEAPNYPPSTINRGGGDGWTPSFMGPVVVVSGNILDTLTNSYYGVTPFGNQYLGLDVRTHGFLARDSQLVSGFVAGQTYALTLYAADSAGGKVPALDVLFSDGGLTNYLDRQYRLPVGGPYGDIIPFTKIVTLFKAPVNGDILLSLSNVGQVRVAGSISIDNVSIAAVPTPVSEPGTLAMVSLGAGASGLIAIRRRAKHG